MLKKKRTLTEEELSEKYGCSGFCYGGIGCVDGETVEYQSCHNIEFCLQTRRRELLATMFATLTVIFGIPAFFVVLVIMLS